MFEFPAILNLCDWTVKLLDYGNKREKPFFEQRVKPCFEAAEKVRDNFVSIYTQIEKAIEDDLALAAVDGLIFTRRSESLGARDTLRAQLRHISPEKLTRFERGIIAILEGPGTHALMSLHAYVCARLAHIGKLKADGELALAASRKAALLLVVKNARKKVEDSWKEVAEGYADYVDAYLRHPA